jgi:hypothetical protein
VLGQPCPQAIDVVAVTPHDPGSRCHPDLATLDLRQHGWPVVAMRGDPDSVADFAASIIDVGDSDRVGASIAPRVRRGLTVAVRTEKAKIVSSAVPEPAVDVIHVQMESLAIP